MATMECEGVSEKEKEEVTEEVPEEDKALIEFYSSFKDLFEFFCLNTTIHGTIRLVCSSRNKMKTAFWTLLFLASFGMLYWQFGSIFNQFWCYGVAMSISVHSEPKMFPAITLCNLNPHRVGEVEKSIMELDNLAKETLKSLYNFDLPEYVLGDEENWSTANASGINGSSFQLDRSIALVKQPYGEVGFRLCNATGGECYNKNYYSGVDAVNEWYRFHYMNIMSQVPPMFNFASADDHINEVVFACQYNGGPCRINDTEHFHHPIYGSCYTFNSNGTDYFWSALKPGILYGLSLILKVEQKDYIPLLSTQAGIKVMIHNHNQTPFLEHEGFDIRPGVESTIGIKQDKVNRLGGNYGDCTHDGTDVDVKLIYKSNYTLQACLYSCFQQMMIDKCGCGYYYYPLPDGAEYCNYNKHPAWGHCFYLLYDKLADHDLPCFSLCPKPCTETVYTLSAGYAKWPSERSENWIYAALQAQNNYSTISNKSDIAKVNIFYKQLDYNSWDESPDYPVSLAMSNMGSQWSLWFGSSVLSVIEVFEFALDVAILSLIYFYKRLRAKKHRINHLPPVPSVSLTLEKYRYMEEGLTRSPNTAKPYAQEASDNQRNGLPPYPKDNKCRFPELYSAGVVLNGFKHRNDHSADTDTNRSA
ncbi:amiloride-sensitive sodium channel subunit delta [Hemicordylus capensis]|uniref:amiloride-sensitive sodium channel subunit delta n=1 Tax=Hemicordylus capensis TaxID=884348 RepID=UPI0023029700|nr:amiloride-sensitive sodium channel subunit delta [Hemicordylus capensis]XP_053137538.1 amiloride-sensitive sodium channel subunit delta [Hemicordylus capensis]XP_053137539.1 amiloride-sensitive sodium channel subunit delta [Hemicordylus capensis]